MIWGMTLEPGKLYTEVIGDEVQLSMASLESRKDFEGSKAEGTCHIIMKTEKSEYLLCTLANGVIYQQSLDLKLMPREKVTFSVQGPNMVYLTGYSTSYPDIDDHLEDGSDTGEWEPYDAGGETSLDASELNESVGMNEEGERDTGSVTMKGKAETLVDRSPALQAESGANQQPTETPGMPDHPAILLKQELRDDSDQLEMTFSIAAPEADFKQEQVGPQGDVTGISEDDSELSGEHFMPLGQEQLSGGISETQSELNQQGSCQPQQQSNQYMLHHHSAGMLQQGSPVRGRGSPQTRQRGRGRPVGSYKRQSPRFSPPAGIQQTFQQDHPLGSAYSQVMPAQVSPHMPTASYQGTPSQPNLAQTHMQHQVQALLDQPGSSRQAVPGLSPSSGSRAIHPSVRGGKRGVRCLYCQKSFPTAWKCQRHERIHTGAKPYVCRYCPKAFRYTDRRRKHEECHRLGNEKT